jgi:hypothetical protein
MACARGSAFGIGGGTLLGIGLEVVVVPETGPRNGGMDAIGVFGLKGAGAGAKEVVVVVGAGTGGNGVVGNVGLDERLARPGALD